jgi:putative molybdopterin biosynthesis protein
VAAPLPRGAGTISSLARADAFVRIPAQAEGLSAEKPAIAELLKDRAAINGAILAIGSHDNALAIVDGLLREKNPAFSLASANVGSLGGLLALSKGLAHLAGCHLLGSDGVYNREAFRSRLPGIPVVAIRLVERTQGLMVKKGNPKKIAGLIDLIRPDVVMSNRQKGSGTRTLLDFELKKLAIDPLGIKGYDDEESTHLNVAVAVLSGRADVGLGVLAAANALGLDFIPVSQEEYDLAIPKIRLRDERILALLEIIRGPRFKELAGRLGVYGFERTGEEIFSIG